MLTTKYHFFNFVQVTLLFLILRKNNQFTPKRNRTWDKLNNYNEKTNIDNCPEMSNFAKIFMNAHEEDEHY